MTPPSSHQRYSLIQNPLTGAPLCALAQASPTHRPLPCTLLGLCCSTWKCPRGSLPPSSLNSCLPKGSQAWPSSAGQVSPLFLDSELLFTLHMPHPSLPSAATAPPLASGPPKSCPPWNLAHPTSHRHWPPGTSPARSLLPAKEHAESAVLTPRTSCLQAQVF